MLGQKTIDNAASIAVLAEKRLIKNFEALSYEKTVDKEISYNSRTKNDR